ncbi:DUF3013 family protein [Lapidilactobacillus bayanensis]|uniref:DUF3013 family protein n=1 Tax=Lapidilactobacillus bayanensis TaxID=2485998 RepID=UPI0013DE1C95|nr:DUF3013 family protein [Lapidilactobacillus bayanensis]
MDMMTYFDQQIDQLDFPGDINVNWDQDIRSFELEITMTGMTNKMEIEDQEGALKDDEVSYDDAILIYDETKVDGKQYAENYVATIPFNGRQGLPLSVADGLFAYLKDWLADGMSNFMDFLDPEMSVETFILAWQEDVYQQAVQAAVAAGVTGYLSYPKY